MRYAVYILASRRHGTLYIGVTNNVAKRLAEHQLGAGSKFVRDYKVTRLVHVALIERENPDWLDLTPDLI